ncbi:MAG: hypothetical protein Phog2KO_05340 [Phototrophicaceae bacterium]
MTDTITKIKKDGIIIEKIDKDVSPLERKEFINLLSEIAKRLSEQKPNESQSA